MERIRLGLFGAGIGRSQAPRLHVLAGRLCDLAVSYELFDLNTLGADTFEQALERTAERGLHGVNVTHPVKERTAKLVTVPDPAMRQIGAVNTVRFADRTGHNTDYSGFTKAYHNRFGNARPGKVLMLGAGGVGKAVAFALLQLGADTALHVVDMNRAKAAALVGELEKAGLKAYVHDVSDLPELAAVDGLINCTPLGMVQYPGSALPKHLIGGQRWAFDAVYTPLETEFMLDARKAGLEILSGYELFFYQGVDAFEVFTGQRVDETRLRQALAANP